MTRALLSTVAVLSASCGLTSPGGGTGTFFVTARLTSDGSTAGSEARVTVRLGSSTGALVKNAEVAIRGGALGRTIVPYDDQRDQYRLDSFTWVEDFAAQRTTRICPFMAATRCLTIDKPRPVPPAARSRALSAR